MSRKRSISFFILTIAISLLILGDLPSQEVPSQKKVVKEQSKNAPLPKKQNVKPVAYWMNRLSHAKFSEREQASSELVKVGSNAIKPLQQQAKSKDLESALRAVTVLGEIYHRSATSGDSTSFLASESALMNIKVSQQRTVSTLASSLLENHSEARRRYAVKEIEKLGGIITWLENANERADFPEAEEQQQIAFILLGRKWKGNDESLQLFRRIPQLGTLMISGKGAQSPVSEKGLDFLKMTLPNLSIQHRGTACLGVRGYDSTQFGRAGLPKGCTLTFIKPGSSADRSGLKTGDVITQFGTKKVTNFQILIDAISEHDPGEKVTATIQRGGTTQTLAITLQEWKP